MAFEMINTAMGRPVRGILFDMDGLILDSETLYSRFWQEAAVSLGFPMTRPQALGLRSLSRIAGSAKMHSYFGPEADYEQIRNQRIRLMDAYVAEHGIPVKPGIYDLLDFLQQQNIPAALASSSPRDRIAAYLAPHRLAHRFRVICSGYEVPHGKPEPDIFLEAAGLLKLAPRDCMVLEDSPAGILAAHRAGCMPVMVPDQDQPEEETRALLYAKADCLTDVIRLINS